MPGELRGDHVWVADEREAGTLYNKGAFGQPQRGGALKLDLLEAAYLCEERRLDVAGSSIADLLALGARLDPQFETRWLAFRDLRKRGYVMKADGDAFHVFPRGGFPGKTPSAILLRVAGEAGTFDLEQLVRDAMAAGRNGRALLLAVVDEEGDITHYDVTLREPKGSAKPSTARLHGEAQVLRDRAVLWEAKLAADLRAEFLGRPLGDALLLSLTEALWLEEERGLALRDAQTGQPLRPGQLIAHAARQQRDFALRHDAYRALRARGLVVKTGYKYGTHFRAYAEDPERAHAEYLAHALPEGFTCPWPDIAGVVRLAHSVRKTLLLVSGTRVLALERARP
ncbi:MAG: tRNA-intron lyase [Halobacteriales archaeon]|nr:tRNA-intron lyase [Halobacteriales archaeon]